MNKAKSAPTQAQIQIPTISSMSPGELHRMLLSGKSTGVAVISCSEMDVCANLPHDPRLPIFVWQNFGAAACDSGGLLDVMVESNVSDVVIFSHYPCEIIELGLRAEFASDESSQGGQNHFMALMRETRERMRAKFGDRFDRHVMMRATQDFILQQVAAVHELQKSNSELREKELRFHAWLDMPEIEDIWGYDSACHSFCTNLVG